MAGRRAVAAYKYTTGTEPPDGLAHIAVVEIPEGSTVPAHLAHWDVTYYDPSDDVPGWLARFAAWAYSWGDAIPGHLRQVATLVAAAIVTLFGDGKLDFSNDEDSHHIVTIGL